MKLFIKILSLAMAVILVGLITLAVMGRINFWYFWIYAAIAALYAYKVLPRLNK